MEYSKLLERFGYFLKLRGLSLTKERKQILETVCDMSGNFTVDDLYFATHSAGKKTSKATLYRTIQLLLECRILRESALGGRQTHYELAEAGPHHGHMVCQHCGRVSEFSGPTLERFINETSGKKQFLELNVQITFSGICNECVKTNPESLRREVCVPFLKYERERESEAG